MSATFGLIEESGLLLRSFFAGGRGVDLTENCSDVNSKGTEREAKRARGFFIGVRRLGLVERCDLLSIANDVVRVW